MDSCLNKKVLGLNIWGWLVTAVIVCICYVMVQRCGFVRAGARDIYNVDKRIEDLERQKDDYLSRLEH